MSTARGSLNSRPELFASPWLVFSVFVLIVNDWVLKPVFHNAFTGKLSDVVGLLALTLFACAISERFRWWAASFITLSFIYWKSPYSQQLIAYLNVVLPVGLGRTPDYTDLIALPVIWTTAYYVPRLQTPNVRTSARYGMAGLSLLALTATSYFPQYTIRETAAIESGFRADIEKTSSDLERMIDRVAARYGLTCNVCDPISDGRIYVGSATSLSLLARFNQASGQILYEVRTYDIGRGKTGSQDVDAVRAQLVEEFRKMAPSVAIENAGRPAQQRTNLGVWKRNAFTSFRTPQNQSDIESAKRIVADATKSFGLKKYESMDDVYYLGALFGWPPYARELVVYVGTGDDPLVDIIISRSSDRFATLQQAVAAEIERRLKEEFGANRAGQRCWLFAC